MRGIDRIGGFGGKSDVLAEGRCIWADPAAYKNDLKRMQAATPADVQAAANAGSPTVSTSSKCIHSATFTNTEKRGPLQDAGTDRSAEQRLPKVQHTSAHQRPEGGPGGAARSCRW